MNYEKAYKELEHTWTLGYHKRKQKHLNDSIRSGIGWSIAYLMVAAIVPTAMAAPVLTGLALWGLVANITRFENTSKVFKS